MGLSLKKKMFITKKLLLLDLDRRVTYEQRGLYFYRNFSADSSEKTTDSDSDSATYIDCGNNLNCIVCGNLFRIIYRIVCGNFTCMCLRLVLLIIRQKKFVALISEENN